MKYELDQIDESIVTLDTYNSDLNLVIEASKYIAHPLTKEGFAFMWAGARATHGIQKGKSCFEVKVIEHLDVSHLPADEPNPHVVRVGFSVDSTSMQLGEDPLSYGYGGTGKTSTNCQFKNFGPPFVAGDSVLAVVDMDSDPVQIGFAKNGKFIGWAYKVKKSELEGKALFPHVLTKNCAFEVNFGQKDEPYFKLPDPVKDFIFIGCLPLDQRVGGTRPPEKREDCEMIMMCGLPGAGKSVWAADFSKKHPEKKYNVLGTNDIIDKMKVMGLPRKHNYSGRWDVLIRMATKCLNSMFAIGSKLRRNYILDQTNVYPTAQRRKMRNFDGFKRIAVVVVPSEAEYKRRCDKRDREEGKEVPDSAVLEMKANFKLPEVNDVFDEVIFTELQRPEAEKLVKVYNEEGKSSMGPQRKQFRPNEPDEKGFDNRKGGFGYNRNDMPDSRVNARGNFQDDQGMRGFGGRGGNRGGFNSGRGRGFDSGYGGRDFNSGRGGYGDRSNYDNFGSGRDNFDNTYGGERSFGYEDKGRGGYDGNRDIGRGGFDGNRGGGRGGYDGNRGGGRGGYDGNRGGGRGGYDGNRGGGRGSYDGNHGGSFGGNRDVGRGGYDGNRDAGRGSYDGNRGRGRGGFESNRGGGRGGFESNRGGGRGGFESSRGGGRGGYNGNRGSGRGGYEGNRGRGGYDGSRGGGRGSFDNRGNSRDDNYAGARSDSYDSRADAYSMYGTSGFDSTGGSYSSGYGSDRRYDAGNRSDQTADMYKSDYTTESIPGGARRSGYGYSDYSSESSVDKISSQGYGNNASGDFKRGSSTTRFQQDGRGSAAHGISRGASSSESYPRDNYSSSYATGGSANVQSSYSEKSYGYGSGSYADYNKPQSTDSYATQSSYTSASANIKTEPTQRFAGSNIDTSSKYTQGSGYTRDQSRPSRWSADTSQTPAASVATYSTGRPQDYAYPKTDQAVAGYQDKQTYGYQQATTVNAAAPAVATQPWMGTSATSTPTPAAYGMAQTQWMQYGQQLPNQYYTQ